jgi:hypothetical protein
MALSSQQRSILNTLLSRARAKGASPKVTKALVEAGLVESNLSNPHGGDRDSQGVLQQRPSQGWGTPAQVTDPAYAADKFIDAAAPLRGKYGTAGALAQAVQRSGFPGRYQERSDEAAQLLGGAPTTTSAPTPSAGGSDRRALLQQYVLSKGNTNPDDALLTLAAGLRDAKNTTPASAQPKAPTDPTGMPKGVGHFEGKPVAAWIVPALTYARAHGWKGTVTSGYRSYADQQRIYNSGVRPAAKPGTSNHEGADFPRGAIDATDAAQLSAILRASPYASKLIYAGTKDPVHFSHPHNGAY